MNKYLRGTKPKMKTATGIIAISNKEAEVRFMKKVLVELNNNLRILKRQIEKAEKELKSCE